jgi:NTE family protein
MALLMAVPLVARAAQCVPATDPVRPKIGLALGGGGARGAAHVGVLKMLEEMRIPVDFIAGTSVGAVVGGFYATGMPVEEIEDLLLKTNWAQLFSDASKRQDRPLRRKLDDALGLYGPKFGVGQDASWLPGGAIAGQNVNLLLEKRVSERVQTQRFDELPIPFHAIATDLVSGDMVVLREGQLSMAMRTSMSVPGIFDPVPAGDALLIDGGVSRNLPVDVVRDMGADVVIAVNVEFPLLEVVQLDSLLAIIGQLSTLMVVNNTKAQIDSLGDGDILIQPELGTEFGSTDFDRARDVIPIGYAASARQAEALSGLMVSAEEYRAWRSSLQACITGTPVLHFLRLENRTRFSDDVLLNRIGFNAGQQLDVAALERDLQQIHALGFIRHARYRLVEEAGITGVVVEVEQDQRGTDIIESGLEITGDSRDVTLDLKVAYLKTDLDERGSEFRGALQVGREFGALSELYMPLDDHLRWVFQPSLRASRRDISIFNTAGNLLELWELDEVSGSVSIGREFGRHAGLFLTVSHYAGDAEVGIGDPAQDNFRFKGGEWSLTGIYDRLDNRYLPSQGSLARISYILSDRSLGADSDFKQAELNWFTARSWGRHTGWLETTFNSTLDDNAPVHGLYTAGGFLNMSGFEVDELVGQHFGFTMLGYRYRLNARGLLPAYAGMTLEYGNAALERADIYREGILNGSVYFGYDSPLGPLYLGFGWSEENSGLFFLRLGTLLGGQSVGRR